MDVTEMNKVVSCIYTRCDPTNTDSVPVCNILEVIRPFLEENVTQLEELQKMLDPNNSNPCISSARFFEAMNQWASQITNNDTFEVTQEFVNEERLAHSTPRPKHTYYNLLKSCSEVFNASLNSTSDDRETLEEKVKQLQHDISITTNELDEVKKQLSQTSEHNEILTKQLNEMTANVTALKNTNDELLHYKLDHQEMKEELTQTKLKCERMHVQWNEHLKAHKTALQEISKLENKKTILEDQLDSLRNKDQISTKAIIDLKVQLELKNVEISNLEASVNKLTKQLDENKATIEYFEQLLETCKASLEKCLCKNVSEKARATSNLFNKTCYGELSSPGLVQKILVRAETKLAGNDDILKQCLLKNVQSKSGRELLTPKKHILDESLPVAFKNLPVLSPDRETSSESLSLSDHIKATRPVEDQRSCCPTPRRAPKSLKDEMSEVKSAEQSPSVSEVQDEIEHLQPQIKKTQKLNKTNEVTKIVDDKQLEGEEEEIKVEINTSHVERTWANINESLCRIKEFASELNHSRLSSDFIDDQLAVIDRTDSTKEALKKLLKSLLDCEGTINCTRERYQELFDDRVKEYMECICFLNAFSPALSAPMVRDLSSPLLEATKLMGMRESDSMSLNYFKTILEHVVALENHQGQVATPSEASQNVERTEMDDAPLAAEESFPDDRIFRGDFEHVEEQTEIYNTTLHAEESSDCTEPKRNRCRRSFLKILLSLFMVIIVSIFYFQLVQWNCARVARRVICPFDWLMTRTISGQLF